MKNKLSKIQVQVGIKILEKLKESGIKTGHSDSDVQFDQLQYQQTPGSSLLMPLGSDNCLLNVAQENNGSIIAYALSSNLYKEALIKNNYLDFQQRAKNLI